MSATLQVASALLGGTSSFVTNDRALARLVPLLDVVVLDDWSLRVG